MKNGRKVTAKRGCQERGVLINLLENGKVCSFVNRCGEERIRIEFSDDLNGTQADIIIRDAEGKLQAHFAAFDLN